MTDLITRLRGDGTSILAMRDAANEIERLRAELQHARDGLTKGRTRMREDIKRLRAAAEQARAALRESRHYDWDGVVTYTVIEPALRALDAALEKK